ncbi:MAG: YIP1 family protein [Vicinamibacteraceae bacterium]
MTEQVLSPAEAPQLSFWSRVSGMFTAPRETFAAIVAHPRWLGVLILTTVVGAGGMAAFVATPTGEQAVLNEQMRQRERTGQPMSSEDVASFREFAPMFKFVFPVAVLVFAPIFAFLLALLLFGYGAILGGSGTYKQVLAIVTHAGVVSLLHAVVIHPLNYVRQSMQSATSLNVFFPMLADDTFFGRLFGWVELFMLWQIILFAIGLSVLYRRRTGPIAWTLLGVYSGIALAVVCYQTFVAGA